MREKEKEKERKRERGSGKGGLRNKITAAGKQGDARGNEGLRLGIFLVSM